MKIQSKVLLSLALTLTMPALAGAQTILIPVGTVYESSEFPAGGYGAANLFDGTGLNTASPNLGNQFAANGASGFNGYNSPDPNPTVAFSLASSYIVGSVDYAQRDTALGDDITGGTVYALTSAQYTSYTAGLQASGTTGGAAVAPPAAFVSDATFTALTGTTTYNNDALSAALTGQYFVVNFTGVPTTGGNANPGGAEFELVTTAPEPGTYALLLLGLGGLVLMARRHRAFPVV